MLQAELSFNINKTVVSLWMCCYCHIDQKSIKGLVSRIVRNIYLAQTNLKGIDGVITLSSCHVKTTSQSCINKGYAQCICAT